MLLNNAVHVVTQPYWTQVALTESFFPVLGIDAAPRPTMLDSLRAPQHIGDRLLLPRLTQEFQQWQPCQEHGPYAIRYDCHNRVFFIKNEAMGIDINLSSLWDARYVQHRLEEKLVDRNAEVDLDDLVVAVSFM
jgi:hypothetical protein